MSDIENDKSNNQKNEKRKVIPLQKAYIWGTVFCLAALIGIVLFNILKISPATDQRIDYLALLRESHSQAVKMKGIIRKGDKTIGDLQDLMSAKIGKPVVFPDWLGTDPGVDIVGVKNDEFRNDSVAILVFRSDNKQIDFITIYSKPDEVYGLTSITMEGHLFLQYNWESNNGFFWELEEDNQPMTYGLISNMDEVQLRQMALETMLSLRTYFEGKNRM